MLFTNTSKCRYFAKPWEHTRLKVNRADSYKAPKKLLGKKSDFLGEIKTQKDNKFKYSQNEIRGEVDDCHHLQYKKRNRLSIDTKKPDFGLRYYPNTATCNNFIDKDSGVYNNNLRSPKTHKIILHPTIFSVLKIKKPASVKIIGSADQIYKDKKDLKDFTDDFVTVCSALDYESQGFLNYSKFCNLLKSLKFISDPFYKSDEERELILKAWKKLKGSQENKIKIEDLYVFLLATLKIRTKINYKTPLKNTHSLFNLSKEQIMKIHADFQLFYDNRYQKNNEILIKIQDSDGTDKIMKNHSSLTPEIKTEPNIFPSHITEIKEASNPNSSNTESSPEVFLSIPESNYVRKTSQVNINSTPKNLAPRVHVNLKKLIESNSGSSKNLSFNTSESDLGTHNDNSPTKFLIPNIISVKKIHSQKPKRKTLEKKESNHFYESRAENDSKTQFESLNSINSDRNPHSHEFKLKLESSDECKHTRQGSEFRHKTGFFTCLDYEKAEKEVISEFVLKAKIRRSGEFQSNSKKSITKISHLLPQFTPKNSIKKSLF
jgi:hypothetical protein